MCAHTTKTRLSHTYCSFIDEDTQEPYYLNQIQNLPDYDKTTVYVDFNHVWKFDEDLGQVISNQYYR